MPNRLATPVQVDRLGTFMDLRVFALGGFRTDGTLSMDVRVFNGVAWTTLTTTTTVAGASGSPVARHSTTAAYMTRCNDTHACIVMVGGATATGALLNDVWTLWVEETRPRWERIAAANLNAPTARAGAATAVSDDGSAMFVYGGQTVRGASSEMFALSPRGFADSEPAEMTNIALNMRATQSTTDAFWGHLSTTAATDNNLNGNHDVGKYCLRACAVNAIVRSLPCTRLTVFLASFTLQVRRRAAARTRWTS